MISQILQHLDSLEVELSAIDPTQDIDAADKVAGIAQALRQVMAETRGTDAATAPFARDKRKAA